MKSIRSRNFARLWPFTGALVVLVAYSVAGLLASVSPSSATKEAVPSFYRDVLPILRIHCQSCHRVGGIGPFPLETYTQVFHHARDILRMTSARKMPPWFANPDVGHFANDPSLSPREIERLAGWVTAGAPAGDLYEDDGRRHWDDGWNIPKPDSIVKMPVVVNIPAKGDIEYTYEIVPTGFKEDRWVRVSQVLPSSPQFVHHAVIYIRPPDSNWLRMAPVGVPFTASTLHNENLRHQSHWTDSDMLLVYAPGSSPDDWPEGMAKFIPAGSDLVFQMHYTTNSKAGTDLTSVGMIFAAKPPTQRVITLQLTNDSFVIPPGADNYPVQVRGSLPNDATLLSFFPHMHLRGKAFEYNIVHSDGSKETLLHVNYDFHWQLSYKLAEPRSLKAGTILEAIGVFDNSKNNPHNPDPSKEVRWGDQTYEEMMVGFFDIAIPANMDKQRFFIRQTPPHQ